MKYLQLSNFFLVLLISFVVYSYASCPVILPDGCSVCGEGKCINQDKKDAVFSFPGQPAVPCGTLESVGISGLIPLDQCTLLPKVPEMDVCDCQPSSPVAGPSRAPTPSPTPRPTILVRELVSTPRFGACVNKNNSALGACSLGPLYCDIFTEKYVKAVDIEGSDCTTAVQVNVGRCNSNLDENRCAISKDNCDDGNDFVPNDETCNVVQDLTSSNLLKASSQYPYCNLSNDDSKCVLGKNDCDERGGVIAKVGHLSGMKPCYCHDVPTGLCYLSNAQLTEDKSFCAVSAEDCPDDYSFKSAFELESMDDPPRVCRLCREGDASASTHEHVVESGACYLSSDNKNFVCALKNTQCSNPNIFKSAAQMKALGHVPCPADDFTGGYCTSSLDNVGCANIAEACFFPKGFERRNTCLLHSNLDMNDQDQLTHFGRCRERTDKGGNFKKYRCAWQESECTNVERWDKASLAKSWFDNCNCEHVLTGACQSKSKNDEGEFEYHCAVSALGCGAGETYIKSYELEDKANGMVCRLCHPRRPVGEAPTPFPTTEGHGNILSGNTPLPTASPTTKPITSQRTRQPTRQPTQPLTMKPYVDSSSDKNIEAKSESSSPSTGTIAGIVVGAVVGGVIFIFLVVFVTNKSRKRSSGIDNATAGKINGVEDIAIKTDEFKGEVPQVL